MTTHRYSDTLRAVAPILAELRYGLELLRILAEHERHADPYDRSGTEFDTAEAVYYIGCAWHGGQWSAWYRAQCATKFRPGACWRRPERGSSAADLAARLFRVTCSAERAPKVNR